MGSQGIDDKLDVLVQGHPETLGAGVDVRRG